MKKEQKPSGIYAVYEKIERLLDITKAQLVIKPLQRLDKQKKLIKIMNRLRRQAKGTVGHDLIAMLDKYQLKLIPHSVEHDLKHLILGFGMDTQSEIKMQVYLIGNGIYSFTAILFSSSVLLFPHYWKEYYEVYKKGCKAPSIKRLTLNTCAQANTKEIISKYTL